MIKLTPVERSALRAEAHGLKPIVMVSESGLTENIFKEIELGLDAHGLIKVRVFGDDREARIAMYEEICARTGAAPVQHIGKLLVLYRPKKEVEKQRAKVGKGLREVTIVKPSPSGTKKPTVTKVLLKGNERVTQGGNIRRAKTRQTSAKKSALGSK